MTDSLGDFQAIMVHKIIAMGMFKTALSQAEKKAGHKLPLGVYNR